MGDGEAPGPAAGPRPDPNAMRLHVIQNPSAGRGQGSRLLSRVAEALSEQGHDVTTFVGHEPGDLARHVAACRAEEFDCLVVAGGDGTLRAVVNARPLALPWPVAVLPVGTANLMARETGMPLHGDVQELVRRLLEAEPWPVDLLEIRRPGAPIDLAISTVSVGVDAEVVHGVYSERGNSQGGYRRWVVPSLQVLRSFRYTPLEVELDGSRRHQASLVVVQNAHSYAGLLVLSPQAWLDSGAMQVVVVQARTHRDILRLCWKAWWRRLHRDRQARIVRARRLAIRAERPTAVQADGDPAGHTDLEIVLRPRALTLLRARGFASTRLGALLKATRLEGLAR